MANSEVRIVIHCCFTFNSDFCSLLRFLMRLSITLFSNPGFWMFVPEDFYPLKSQLAHELLAAQEEHMTDS